MFVVFGTWNATFGAIFFTRFKNIAKPPHIDFEKIQNYDLRGFLIRSSIYIYLLSVFHEYNYLKNNYILRKRK